MYSWSKKAMEECQISVKPIEYPLKTTGLWGEAVRQRRPIITNDYEAANPYKRGYPEGHVRLRRHLNVPIFDDGRIVALAGVANQSGPYENEDIQQISLLMGFMWSIIKRRRTEMELEQAQALLQAAIDQSPAGIIIADAPDVQIRMVNPAGLTIRTGATADPAQISEAMQPKNWPTFKPDGTPFGHLELPLSRAVRKGETVSNVEVIIRRFSGEDRWVLANAAPARNANGEVIAGIVVFPDITDRKRAEAEKEKLEDQLRQAQKMESVGRLAGGVAHDFNNMLAVILGHTEMALARGDATQTLVYDLRQIQKAAQRSADLTRQLLAFARKQTVVPKVLELNATVAGMLEMLHRLIGENINLVWIPGALLWQVKMDPSQIDQILVNLCVNARDAIGGVGRIVIETRNLACDADYCLNHADGVPGDYVVLTVSDDGRGMDKDILENIFEPFFTTKGVGAGTGLGLSTVYGIVRQNAGFITVDSEPGNGATFKVHLPRHAAPAAQPGEDPPTPGLRGGHETILLVEDEPAILDMSRMMLETMGYRVLLAETPQAAIDQVEASRIGIHLLMTDVVMPGMTGPDLARRIRSHLPNLGILFMSGYSANEITRHGVLEPGVHFIQKPFSIRDLDAKIRQALGGRPRMA